jgi:hypothetical protein
MLVKVHEKQDDLLHMNFTLMNQKNTPVIISSSSHDRLRLAWHLFLLGYQDPTIDGNYELRNLASLRRRRCRRDATRTR